MDASEHLIVTSDAPVGPLEVEFHAHHANRANGCLSLRLPRGSYVAVSAGNPRWTLRTPTALTQKSARFRSPNDACL